MVDQNIEIFISYAHEDEELRKGLEKQLKVLWRQGLIDIWTDRKITPGTEWVHEIDQHLNRAKIILLLISPDFMASDYCYGIEMQRALERNERKEAIVIPVILRPVLWQSAPFTKLQVLPTNATPVTKWLDRDEAFLDIADGIRKVVRKISPIRSTTPVIENHNNQEGEVHDITGWDDNSLINAPEKLSVRRNIIEPSPNNSVPFQAIEIPGIFIGRDEEYAILEKELQLGRKVVVIRNGIGGIGKTSLAAYIAHRLRQFFPDGVLWARVDTEDTKTIMLSFIESFGISSIVRLKYLSTDIARASYYRSLLIEKRCMIVLDNAENAEQVLPLIPFLSSSQTIITTRYSISSVIPEAFELYLNVLSSSASINLFAALSNRALQLISPQLLEDLVSKLGHLPLAIRIAAGIVRDLHWTIDDYLKRLQESPTLDWVSAEDDSISVRKSFAISYNCLSKEITKKIFRTLGIFQQEYIPSAVIASIIRCSLIEVEQSILTLVRRGLIEIEAQKPSHILIHPLMRRYMNELLVQCGEEQATHASAGKWYRNRISFWDDHLQRFQYGVSGTEEDAMVGLMSASHYYQAGFYEQAQQVLVAIADTVSLQGRQDTLVKRLNELHQVTELVPWLQLYRCKSLTSTKDNGKPEEGKNTLLDLAKSSDLKVASSALIYLANMRIEERLFKEAQQLLKESQNLKEQLVPPDSKGITYILNQLALISLQTGGSYRDALEQYKQALSIQRQSNDIKGMAYTLLRTAIIHLRNNNETKQALEILSEAEELAKVAVSKLVLVSIWMEKAEALRRLEYYADAVENLQQALKLAAEFDDPFPEAHVLRRLALLYEQIEFYGSSLRCIERCRAILIAVASEQASKLESTFGRIRTKTKNLEEELHQIEVTLQVSRQIEDGSERRLMRRQCKRLRQKLGLEPALIRLGKHSISKS